MKQQNATYESDSNNRNIDLESTLGKFSELPDPTQTIVQNIVDVNTNKASISDLGTHIIPNNPNIRLVGQYQNWGDSFSYEASNVGNQMFLILIDYINPTLWVCGYRVANSQIYIKKIGGTSTINLTASFDSNKSHIIVTASSPTYMQALGLRQ